MHLSDRMRLILRAGVTLALLAYLLVSIDAGAIASTLSGVAVVPIVLCVPMVCLMYAIRTEKWRILLRSVGIDVDFPQALKVFLIGTFYGSITPGRAGEVSRSFYLSGDKARTIPTVIVDRVTDIVCLLAMSVLMLLAVFHDLLLAAITLATVVGFAALCVALLERRLVSVAAKIFGVADGRRDEYLAAVGTMFRDRRAMLSSLGMALAYYTLNIIVFWLVLMAISPAIDPLISLSLPLIIIMGNVPVSISGLGVRELVSVTIFSAYNESAAYGFSASLAMYVLTTLVPGLAGAALSLAGVRPSGPKSGNYEKYMSKNPLMRRATMRFIREVASLADSVGPSTILDAGCGEGFVASHFGNRRLVGMDISMRSLTVARQMNHELALSMGDVCRIPFRDESFDMVMMCEVLEHLELPDKALAEAGRTSKRYCIFSVPREPYFMLMNLLRGKNITRFGDDAEHVRHWTMKGFIEYVSRDFDVLEVRCPFPWTVVLCVKKGGQNN